MIRVVENQHLIHRLLVVAVVAVVEEEAVAVVVVGSALGEVVGEGFVGLASWFEVALELAHVDIYSLRS